MKYIKILRSLSLALVLVLLDIPMLSTPTLAAGEDIDLDPDEGEIGDRIDIDGDDFEESYYNSATDYHDYYIDIYFSIHAAIIKHYPNRKMKQGDFYDIPILSTVLPYCDVITTDSFMKEILVNKLNFNEKYKAQIFSATKEDRLAFQKLVRVLI